VKYLKAILTTVLGTLVTDLRVSRNGLEVKFLWILSKTISFDRVLICDIIRWRHEFIFFEEKVVDKMYGVVIRHSGLFEIATKVKDIETFTSELRKRAPHVQLREIRDIRRTFRFGKRNS
jgi:hypothetical protein